jgi:hypothetical protein
MIKRLSFGKSFGHTHTVTRTHIQRKTSQKQYTPVHSIQGA